MSEMTPEQELKNFFRICRKNNLHLYHPNLCADIVQKLAEVAEYVLKYKTIENTEEYNDLRVLDNEYVASYMLGLYGILIIEYIFFHRESGITELNFDSSPPSNTVEPSLNTLKTFKDISIQSDGSLLTSEICLTPKESVYHTSIAKDGIVNIDKACPCYSSNAPINLMDISFQPPNCNLSLYTKSTGLPIIDTGFKTLTLDTSQNKLQTSFIPSEDDPEHTYFLSWHMKLQLDSNDLTTVSDTKSVSLVHRNRQAFLDGEEPLIIVFQNIDGRNEVFRRLPSGTYIVNSSVKEKSADISYDEISLQEIIDKSESLIRPHSDYVMSAAKGEFEKVIPQKYIDLYKEVLKKVRPDGQGNLPPENDELELY